MARNIEIKARVADRESLEAAVGAIATAGPTPILQDDTFFACPNGRMKLRDFSTGEGELIFYRRSDIAGPKQSEYVRVPLAAVASLREALALGYGEIGRVRKRRTLYLVGRTRVHLDEVEGLGDFVELEVVLAEHEPAQAGVDEAADLMERLGIAPSHLVEGAYLDLARR
ncbi:MAG: class IV adenylate cyclase [Burkholderiaceae bacterium]|mgnify:CR=1 FL=1|nr:class IV adenylate cyclase [Burkholderiaceae bacterium]